MKYFHSINIRVFSKTKEDAVKVREKLTELVDFLEDKKLKIKEDKASGMYDNPITIFNLLITKEKQTKILASKFLSNQEITDLELRVDENCNFYLRLDKDSFLKDEILLTEEGDCFHLTFSVAAYPKSKENALVVLKTFLNE
jgi:RNA-binding protein